MADTDHPPATTPSGEAGHGAGGHGFDFASALAHHNLPYPAWEPLHGKPLLIFDLGLYAAKNHAALQGGTAPSAKYLDWAEELCASGKVGKEVSAESLARAMSVADQKSWLGSLPRPLAFFNQQIFFGTVALVILAAVLLVFCRRRVEQRKPANRVQHMIEAMVLFVRDDIVRPNIHHGDAWVPHFAAIFFAILACNLMGLIPGTGTATGNIGVTAALALTTFASMLFFGMKAQGVVRFWINLVPVHWSSRPADMLIWFMLLGIELLGLLIKPTALAIRLFANMFAGHTVLLAFCSLGLIVWTAQPAMTALSLGMGGFGLLLAFLIFFLELLVAFIQAYVFTLLSAVFIGSSMHPEH